MANLQRFDELSQTENEWMNEETGGFKALHSMNSLRVPWIVENLVRVSFLLGYFQ